MRKNAQSDPRAKTKGTVSVSRSLIHNSAFSDGEPVHVDLPTEKIQNESPINLPAVLFCKKSPSVNLDEVSLRQAVNSKH